jgi:hypothetical protein
VVKHALYNAIETASDVTEWLARAGAVPKPTMEFDNVEATRAPSASALAALLCRIIAEPR